MFVLCLRLFSNGMQTCYVYRVNRYVITFKSSINSHRLVCPTITSRLSRRGTSFLLPNIKYISIVHLQLPLPNMAAEKDPNLTL
jgi:hypothetical protein